MSALRSAICKLGWHTGDWSLPGSRCETVRFCDGCGKRQEQTHHVWGKFGYLEDHRCDQIRRCDRCRSMESRIRHDWGPWLYQDDELVTAQVHSCRRCHRIEQTRRFSTL
jgi:hypothetical protein